MYRFNQAELEKLKEEYLYSLKMVKKYHSKITTYLGNCETSASYTRFEIGIINTIITDLWESILGMEKFLPSCKQVYLNKKYRGPIRYRAALPAGENPEVRDNPENYVCDLMMQKKLLETIYRLLTPRQFEIVYLYYYQNMNQSRIASRLNLSRPTVTEHLQKAIERIKSSPLFQDLYKASS